MYRRAASQAARRLTHLSTGSSSTTRDGTTYAPAYRLPSCEKKVGSNLGPNAAELGPKPCTMTQNKARRTNKIDFLQLPWAQEVRGSNPRAPTKSPNRIIELTFFPFQ